MTSKSNFAKNWVWLLLAGTLNLAAAEKQTERTLPVRGFCIPSPSGNRVDEFIKFIEEELAPRSVNVLILRVDYGFQFLSRPEMADSRGLSKEQAQKIATVCKQHHIRIIPLIDLLGHQSWHSNCGKLLKAHPDFDETPAVKFLEKFDEPARKAGVTVVPAVAFYGGLADLMVTAVLGDWDAVDSIEVLMGIDSWHPTQGTRNTIARNAVGNLMITGGRLTPLSPWPVSKRWSIPGPLGHQAVVEVPFSEAILISRHVKTSELHNYLPQIAVSEVLDSTTPDPKPTDAMGRSAQRFVIEVVVTRGNEKRRAISRGQDSYAVTAPLACEAVARLLKGNIPPGAHAPGEIFDGKEFLEALGRDHLTLEIATH